MTRSPVDAKETTDRCVVAAPAPSDPHMWPGPPGLALDQEPGEEGIRKNQTPPEDISRLPDEPVPLMGPTEVRRPRPWLELWQSLPGPEHHCAGL